MDTRALIVAVTVSFSFACKSECEQFAEQVLAAQDENPLMELIVQTDEDKKVFAKVFPDALCTCLEPKLRGTTLSELVASDEGALNDCAFDAGEKAGEAVAALSSDEPATPSGPQIDFCGDKHDANTASLSCYDEVSSFDALAKFTALTSLDLVSVQGGDLAPIGALKSLEALSLGGPGVKGLEFLTELSKLESFRLNGAPVETLESLVPLAATLKSLELRELPETTDPPPAAKPPRLESLSLYWVGAKDLAPLAPLIALKQLEIQDDSEAPIDFLAGMSKLESLNVSTREPPSWKPLAKLSMLTELDIAATNIESLAPTAKLGRLKTLSVMGNGIKSLAGIEKLPKLESLDISGTAIRDIRPLKKLTGLKKLDVSDTSVSKIKVLESIPSLVSVNLGETEVRSLKPLSKLQNLESVYLIQGKVRDVTPLMELPKLCKVNLWNAKVSAQQASALAKKLRSSCDYASVTGPDGELVEEPGEDADSPE